MEEFVIDSLKIWFVAERRIVIAFRFRIIKFVTVTFRFRAQSVIDLVV
jgi:hypothetical protein